MYGSLARRAALAVSAFATILAVTIAPATASADSLFQGAITPPSPSPSPTPDSLAEGTSWQAPALQGASGPGANPQGTSWPGMMPAATTAPSGLQLPGASWPGSAPQPGTSGTGAVPQPGTSWPGPSHPPSAAGSGSMPPAVASPAPLPLLPDVKVTSLGIVRGTNGSETYTFQVKNVGKGSAPDLKITRQAVIKRKGEKTWVRTEVSSFVHAGGLQPGQDLTVEVACPASDKQYCDAGGVLADVVGTPEDADPSNNHMMEFNDIKG